MRQTVFRDALVFALLVGVAVVSRLLPHDPNFTAVMGVALLASVVFRSRIVAAAVPLTAMVISDSVLGWYEWRLMLAVYGAMLLPLAVAPLLRAGRAGNRLARVGLASVACSLLFFAITNSAVWAFGTMYEPTIVGLAASLVAGLPFLKYQLAGDLSWSLVLFSALALWPRSIGTARAPLFAPRAA